MIVETFAERGLDPLEMPAALVASHGPFAWGADVEDAVENAVALEAVAASAYRSLQLAPGLEGDPGGAARQALPAQARRRRLLRPADVKSLRLHAAGELRLHEEPDPEPQPGEVLVRSRGVGLCGSDRHWFLEGGIGDAVLREPLVLGHEFAGVVAERARAQASASCSIPPCRAGAARSASRGSGHLCADMRFAGHGSTDGALRTLVAWPEQLAPRAPRRGRR